MSPILTRPVREQFEHDRIIRLLQGRYRRKFEVTANPGAEQHASVTVGEQVMFPDLVLFSQERGRRLEGTIEVETGESVNSLEAMSQWALLSRLRAPFVLYVPPAALDGARRLCAEHAIPVAEIWTYHTALDQVRFTMVYRAPAPPAAKPRAAASAGKAERRPAAAKAARPAKTAKTAKTVKTVKTAKTVAKRAVKAKPKAKAAKGTAKKTSAKTAAAGAQKRTGTKTKAAPVRARKAAVKRR